MKFVIVSSFLSVALIAAITVACIAVMSWMYSVSKAPTQAVIHPLSVDMRWGEGSEASAPVIPAQK